MTDIPDSTQPIQVEATRFRAPGSESIFQETGGAINYCLTKVANLLARMLVAESNYNPVGTVVASLLTEAQYQAIAGSGWILCDGRSVSGSAYDTLTGRSSVPDARGFFLRGKNNGRNDGFQNPDGDLTLGNGQGEAFHTHNHTVDDPGHTHTGTYARTGVTSSWQLPGGTDVNYNGGIDAAFTGIGLQASGGNETRPKNITINWMIRIN